MTDLPWYFWVILGLFAAILLSLRLLGRWLQRTDKHG